MLTLSLLLCAIRTGIIVYFRKEGRALGEVTKYLVYNLRKRQEGVTAQKSTSTALKLWLASKMCASRH